MKDESTQGFEAGVICYRFIVHGITFRKKKQHIPILIKKHHMDNERIG
jgi:hypothetical protein